MILLLAFLALNINIVYGHGRLNVPMTRGGPGYENDPCTINDANHKDWICRHENPMTVTESYQAGSSLQVEYHLSAPHVGDCEIFLSYDYDKPREEMKWFKIANHPDCRTTQSTPTSPNPVNVYLPTWLKSGTVTLRWSWYALHTIPNVEFFVQCADINIISTNSELPTHLVTYSLINPNFYPNSGKEAPGYRNPYGNGPQWLTGPPCALGMQENRCGETTEDSPGYLSIGTEGVTDGTTDGTVTDDSMVDSGVDSSVDSSNDSGVDSSNDSSTDSSTDSDTDSADDDEGTPEWENPLFEDCLPYISCPSGQFTAVPDSIATDEFCMESCIGDLKWCDCSVCNCVGGAITTVDQPTDGDDETTPDPNVSDDSCITTENWYSVQPNVSDEWCVAVKRLEPDSYPNICKCGDNSSPEVGCLKWVSIVDNIADSWCVSVNTVEPNSHPESCTCEIEGSGTTQNSWRIGGWVPVMCPSACGQTASEQTRTVRCTDNLGNTVDEVNCNPTLKPPAVHVCPATDDCQVHDCGSFPNLPSPELLEVGFSTLKNVYYSVTSNEITFQLEIENLEGWVAVGLDTDSTMANVYAFSFEPENVRTERRLAQHDIGTQITGDDRIAKNVQFSDSCIQFTIDRENNELNTCVSDWRIFYAGGEFSYPSHHTLGKGSRSLIVAEDCPVITYSWEHDDWVPSTCSNECGQPQSTLNRNVTCKSSLNETVDNSMCDSSIIPDSEFTCDATSECGSNDVVYDWVEGDWEPISCPTQCGLEASEQTRSVTCEGDDGTVAPNNLCTGDAPDATQVCNATDSCETDISPSDDVIVQRLIDSLNAVDSDGLFLYETPQRQWVPSKIYKWNDMIDGVQLMSDKGIGATKFFAGTSAVDGVNYGLVNVAAFLAQSMQETIRYDACDENNWSNGYPATAACGQLGQSYQDYTCSEEEAHMACDVDPNMEMRASTNAEWYGAPGQLFCGPKSKVPDAPKWSIGGWCPPDTYNDYLGPDTPIDDFIAYVLDPSQECKDYINQKAGKWESCPGGCPNDAAPNFGKGARTDVEGCCWWGRGVIQTTGVCNFGKLNYYLGQRAFEREGESLYPTINFCQNPQVICAPDSPPELKWIAGLFFWMKEVEDWNDTNGWNYMEKLAEWVDNGMNQSDTTFIDGASGIVNRGCPSLHCPAGEVHNVSERRANFNKIIDAFKDVFVDENTVVTYSWSYTDWTPEVCPNDCGLNASDRTRTATCMSSTLTPVDDSHCDSNTKESITGNCAATSDCGDPSVTYGWVITNWNPLQCPDDCGLNSSTRHRDVTCMGDDDTIAPDNICTTDKPDDIDTCDATEACPITYHWYESVWNPLNCPSACDLPSSEATRTVICRDNLDNDVDDSFCSGNKPAETKTCSATDPCNSDGNTDGNSGPCVPYTPDYCPSGTFVAIPGSVGSDSWCEGNCIGDLQWCPCDVCKCAGESSDDGTTDSSIDGTSDDSSVDGTVDGSTDSGVDGGSEITYSWDESEWNPLFCPSVCSSPASQRNRTVDCLDSDGVIVDDSMCGDNKPSETSDCPATTECGVTTDAINVCYFTNWARYRNGLINMGEDLFEADLIDGNLCTHFMYGFLNIKLIDGIYKLVPSDTNADYPMGSGQQTQPCQPDQKFWPCAPDRKLRGYEGMAHMKTKNPNIKMLISVGGWNFNDCLLSGPYGKNTCHIFSTIAASESLTASHIQNVIEFARTWGFDGYDIDWEYPVVANHNDPNSNAPVDADYDNYITFLSRMRQAFIDEAQSTGNTQLLLTAAVGVGKAVSDQAYNISEMDKHLDLINLMTYDLYGAWNPQTGFNAPLYATDADTALMGYPLSVSWAVDNWLSKGASASKLTLGFGTYGRGFVLADPNNYGVGAPATGPSPAGTTTGQTGYISYYEIQDKLKNGSATRYWDDDRKVPYIVDNGIWYGYDDIDSFKAKTDFLKSRNLAGSMVWALDLDDFTGAYADDSTPFPLIRTIRSELAGWTPGSTSEIRPTNKNTSLYSWIVGEFSPSECPTACGLEESQKVRTVTCEESTVTRTNNVVDDSNCSENKPDEVVICPSTLDCSGADDSNATNQGIVESSSGALQFSVVIVLLMLFN